MPLDMRRLLRILLNVATVLSLVLCVGTVALWVRSYRIYDRFVRIETMSPEIIGGERGSVVWVLLRRDQPIIGDDPFVDASGFHYSCEPAGSPLMSAYVALDGGGWRLAGLTYQAGIPVTLPPGSFRTRVWIVPCWMLAAGAGILPAVWLAGLRRRRARRRRGAGRCVGCGYDLRATPERCPECGIAVVTRPPISA
jgi:hypothetical protein